MKILNRSFFYSIVFITALPVLLSGCGIAYTAIAMSPGEREIVLKKPDGGTIDHQALKKIRSIATANLYAWEHMKHNRDTLFKKVVKVKKQPVSEEGASWAARANSVDAFAYVTYTGRDVTTEYAIRQVSIFGSATLTIVRRDGKVIYQQTAVMQQGGATGAAPGVADIFNPLARAIVADIKKGKEMDGATTTAKKKEGWLDKIF